MKTSSTRRWACLIALALGAVSALPAQFGYFGQNKIQYRRFDWRVLRGEHVDLYYYPEEEELGRVALAYAEQSYDTLEQRFTHAVTQRIPLIVYASHTNFEQTNILPFIPPEGLRRDESFLDAAAMPFRGSAPEFRTRSVASWLRLPAEHRDSDPGRYPRFRQVGLPLWWTEGLAEFFSAGEDSRDVMILREMTIEGELPTLPQLTYAYGGLVYPVGGSIHRFLAERYGEWRILALYSDIWKYAGFDLALQGVYGRSIEELSDEWQYWMRQQYYPAVTTNQPLAITARKLTELAIKPTAYQLPGDTIPSFLYFSPSSGYTTIYAENLAGRNKRAVVQGESNEQFESFHFFESRMDVHSNGVAAFSSKYAERDALFFWDLTKGKVVARYQFPELVSILSPAWAPDGKSVIFSGLSVSGYSDLYRLWLSDPGDSSGAGRLERLTSDRYEDLDPTISPDGATVVFASDRTPYGVEGAHNLFALDLASGATRYLTYGNWRDEAPRWGGGGEAGERIYFSSDRDGTFQIYSIDALGTGRRETKTLNGAFDPQLVSGAHGGLLFGAYADLSFNIYIAPPLDDPSSTFSLVSVDSLPMPFWTWDELSHPLYARTDGTPYERKFSLDFAAADAVVAPGLGSAQGAVFVFSDLLSDHLMLFTLSSFQTSGFGSLLDNINGTAFYLNQSRRINWGVGAFRQRGLFYEGDFQTLYEEKSTERSRRSATRSRASAASWASIASSTRTASICSRRTSSAAPGRRSGVQLPHVRQRQHAVAAHGTDRRRALQPHRRSCERLESRPLRFVDRVARCAQIPARVAAQRRGAAGSGIRVGRRAAPAHRDRWSVGTARLSAQRLRLGHIRLAGERGIPIPADRLLDDRFPVRRPAIPRCPGRDVPRLRTGLVGRDGAPRRARVERPRLAHADRAAARVATRHGLETRHDRAGVLRPAREHEESPLRGLLLWLQLLTRSRSLSYIGACVVLTACPGPPTPASLVPMPLAPVERDSALAWTRTTPTHDDFDSISLALSGRACEVRGTGERADCAARFDALRLRWAAGTGQRRRGGDRRFGAVGGSGEELSFAGSRDPYVVGSARHGPAARGGCQRARRGAGGFSGGRGRGQAACRVAVRAGPGHDRLRGHRQRGAYHGARSRVEAARQARRAQPYLPRYPAAARERARRLSLGRSPV
jgi:hypothetical protein